MKLLACPECSRQYDVTDIAPQSPLRCACDELFLVEWNSPLRVEALQCSHCGGAVGAGDEVCSFCDAELSEKDRRESTLCPLCYTRIADDAKHCSSCGVAIEPQALTPIPAERGCPRCEGELRIRSLGKTDVVECSRCAGIWLRPGSFDSMCRGAEQKPESVFVTATVLKQRPAEEDFRYIGCLTCGELMARRQFRHRSTPSGVVVDCCRDHGIWLDHSELEKIVRFIKNRIGAGSGLYQSQEPYVGPDVLFKGAGSSSRTPKQKDSLGDTLMEALGTIGSILFNPWIE